MGMHTYMHTLDSFLAEETAFSSLENQDWLDAGTLTHQLKYLTSQYHEL